MRIMRVLVVVVMITNFWWYRTVERQAFAQNNVRLMATIALLRTFDEESNSLLLLHIAWFKYGAH